MAATENQQFRNQRYFVTVQSIFQGSKGKFTVAIRIDNGLITAAYALCGAKDNYSRRTGYHKAVGRLDSRGDKPYKIELGSYHGDSPKEDVFKPIFRKLEQLDTPGFYSLSNDPADFLPTNQLRTSQLEDALFAVAHSETVVG